LKARSQTKGRGDANVQKLEGQSQRLDRVSTCPVAIGGLRQHRGADTFFPATQPRVEARARARRAAEQMRKSTWVEKRKHRETLDSCQAVSGVASVTSRPSHCGVRASRSPLRLSGYISRSMSHEPADWSNRPCMLQDVLSIIIESYNQTWHAVGM
jgi:hypothetical protein